MVDIDVFDFEEYVVGVFGVGVLYGVVWIEGYYFRVVDCLCVVFDEFGVEVFVVVCLKVDVC